MSNLIQVPTKVDNWEDADAVLRVIGELTFQGEAIEAELTRKTQSLKEEYAKKAEVVSDQIKQLEKPLKKFVKKKKEDIVSDGKVRTKNLIFGKVGVRASTKIVITDERKTIDLLKKLRMFEAIITTEKPSREALEKYEDRTLLAVGAIRQATETTWYEVDREKFGKLSTS